MDNLKEGRAINDRPEKKNKSMAIISNTDEGISYINGASW
jgi:hypothetical protein